MSDPHLERSFYGLSIHQDHENPAANQMGNMHRKYKHNLEDYQSSPVVGGSNDANVPEDEANDGALGPLNGTGQHGSDNGHANGKADIIHHNGSSSTLGSGVNLDQHLSHADTLALKENALPENEAPTSELVTLPNGVSYNVEMRHGFSQYNTEEAMRSLVEYFYIYFEAKRHETSGNPVNKINTDSELAEWRIKDRQRTLTGALVLCLNIGVDPPDVIKTKPCATMEAWTDATSFADPKKAIDAIGKKLQSQYEVFSTRTRYKQFLDPCVDDVKRFCMALRRSAKEERVLFHYNGHGVPRPTPSGEVWVFNRGYTQYIPVSIYDLQTWLGAPCIFIFDCHGAGHIVQNFMKFIDKRKVDEEAQGRDPNMPSPQSFEECVLLASCTSQETLPMQPELPADLFTCCLTSPIEIAVKWFVMQQPFAEERYPITALPGKISDRRTPLGELNWIFTSITDTIAWSTLPLAQFKKVFRQDLVVAALCRNFLLAQRIMRSYKCNPVSYPNLPSTHKHPMWEAWDLAVDQCLVQIPLIKKAEEEGTTYKYEHSTFFQQQLTAFEVWLRFKSSDLSHPPEQLPIVLQVLLSQVHRLRALILLSKFLDLGPTAVQMALSIGTFPYILKLLQSPALELKPVLVFIWARLMALEYDKIHFELYKDNAYQYFLQILVPSDGLEPMLSSHNQKEHRAMCLFILTLFVRNFRTGQRICAGPDLFEACATLSEDNEWPLLRQWSCLCISQLWFNYAEGKWIAIKEGVLVRLFNLLKDPVPEVRAAAVHALTNFLAGTADMKSLDVEVAVEVLSLISDASSIVRREVVVFYSQFVHLYLHHFIVAAFAAIEDDASLIKGIDSPDSPAHNSLYATVWRALLVLSEDPFLDVCEYAQALVDYVIETLHYTPLVDDVEILENFLIRRSTRPTNSRRQTEVLNSVAEERNSSTPVERMSLLQRSVSFAHSLTSAWQGADAAIASFDANNGRRNFSSQSAAPNLSTSPEKHGQGGFFGKSSGTAVPTPLPPMHRPVANKTTLPLNSGFFEWCTEYFQEPQMTHSENDEPGSERYVERTFRNSQNEKIIYETQQQKNMALLGKWDTQLNILSTPPNGGIPVKMQFAQFEPQIAVADDKDIVTIWNWAEGTRLNRFFNDNPVGTRITDMKFINEDDQAMLLTGSSEGVVRIYRHHDRYNETELSAAWRVLTDILPALRKSGLVLDWQQTRGSIIAGGDVRVLRIWDAPTELCGQEIQTESNSPVTSITSDQVAGNIIVAGFGDGTVRVFDKRMGKQSVVRTWKEHNSWIVNARMQRGGARELVTASTDGTVHLWDIRASKSINGFKASNNPLKVMDIHEHAPIIMCGSTTALSGFSTSGQRLHAFRHNSLHRQVSGLALHPHRMLMALNTKSEQNVVLYTCRDDV